MLNNRKKSKDRNCSIIVFCLIVLGLTLITCYKSFLLLKSDSLDIFTVLTFVIAVLTMYGIYLGFLQFIISYINKENEAYLGYNKIHFLTGYSKWFQFIQTYWFIFSLGVAITIPVLYFYCSNYCSDSNYCDYLGYLWQGIVGGLIFVYIFLFKFTLKVSERTLDINIKKDNLLLKEIEKAIEKEYSEIFNKIKKCFSRDEIKNFFEKVDEEIVNIVDKKEKVKYFEQVFCTKKFEEKEYSEKEIEIIKEFFEKKYDLLLKQADYFKGDSDYIKFVEKEYNKDIESLNKFFKDFSADWTESKFEKQKDVISLAKKENKEQINYESNKSNDCGFNVEIQAVWSSNVAGNIHIKIFKKVERIFKSGKSIDCLMKAIQSIRQLDAIVKDKGSWEGRGEYNKIKLVEKGSELSINQVVVRKVKKCVVKSRTKEVKYTIDGECIVFSPAEIIEKIEFEFKDGKKYIVKRNKSKDYFLEFEKEAWSRVLKSHIKSEYDLEKVVEGYRKAEETSDISVFRNGEYYSKMCFKYLEDNTIKKDDNYDDKVKAVIKLVENMVDVYRGAFSLYQLIERNSIEWDLETEKYWSILDEVLFSNSNKECFYSGMVSIICSNTGGKNKREIYELLYKKRNDTVINDEWLEEFKNINILKLIVVKSMLSRQGAKIELKNLERKKEIILKYIKSLEADPIVFSLEYGTNGDKNIIYMLDDLVINNINSLKPVDVQMLPLVSFLRLEKHINYWCIYGKEEENMQKLMMNLIGIESSKKPSDLCYRLGKFLGVKPKSLEYDAISSTSILKFFTLKFASTQGEYSSMLNSERFQKMYISTLNKHLKAKKYEIDKYLVELQQELEENSLGLMEPADKELIKFRITELCKKFSKNY